MLKNLIILLALAGIHAITQANATSAIKTETGGIWFNPHNDGEGFFIQIGDDNHTVTTTWYTFDNNRNQMWLIGSGSYSEGSDFVSMELIRPEGASFGHLFNSNVISLNQAGET